MSKKKPIGVNGITFDMPGCKMEVAFTTDRKKAVKYLKRHMGAGEDSLMGMRNAKTVLSNYGGTHHALVFMPDDENASDAQKLGLLAHEGAHIAYWYFQIIGESSPSDEFHAYAVQEAAQILFELREAEGVVGK